jgi:hypothetical protein
VYVILVKQNIVQLAHIDHFAALFTLVEAGAGIEPANSGFADRDLTTWLPRQVAEDVNYSGWRPHCQRVGHSLME